MDSLIPKTIHYCWFGDGKKPKLAQKCISSWKRLCPDYEIIEWNENNFDIDQYPYLRWCYDNKKWAFLSDFARLLIVQQYGGIYFDTDVELVRRPDDLLKYEAFYGFENNSNIATGLGFGAVSGNVTVTAMVQQYIDIQLDKNRGFPMKACPALNTKALIPFGLQLNGKQQNINGTEILPKDYLNPYDDPTGCLHKTENTISIHWYSKSWMSKTMILRSRFTKPLHRIFGVDAFERFRK